MNKKWKKPVVCFLAFLLFLPLGGCGSAAGQTGKKEISEGFKEEKEAADDTLENRNTDISRELSYQGSMELNYAQKFAVDYYQDGYALVSIADDRQYLILPEGKNVPEDLEKDIVILKQPLKNIYLVASAVMDMFCKLDALESIRFSGQEADGWCMEDVQEEMEKGNILYAGKYSMPDYELILAEKCSLAIENNMINHSPEVIEKLEEFGIPVWIDLSSYEEHPLGRVEWVKLYGVLLGKEKAADVLFEEQVSTLEHVAGLKPSGKTVAFFYITGEGMVNVRVSNDYIPKMIGLAGGTYIFEDLMKEDSNRSTVTMQMEEFYHTAKDADYLIYNSTIDGELTELEELLRKEELLKDFDAVQKGHVWCTTMDLYQKSMSVGQMIEDINSMLSDDPDKQKDMRYLYQLK